MRLRQIDLANKVNVTKSSVYYWEKGVKEPRGATLELIVQLACDYGFAIDRAYFYQSNEEPSSGTPEKR